jgi:hypothetical protein
MGVPSRGAARTDPYSDWFPMPDFLLYMQVDNYQFEARPEGHLLMYSNDDKPGVLGAVSTILGQADINIGDFNMGRNKKTAVALRCASPFVAMFHQSRRLC